MKYFFIILTFSINLFAFFDDEDFNYQCWSKNYGLNKIIQIKNYNVLLKGQGKSFNFETGAFVNDNRIWFKNYNKLVMDPTFKVDYKNNLGDDLEAYLPHMNPYHGSSVDIKFIEGYNEALFSISLISDYNKFSSLSHLLNLEIGKLGDMKNDSTRKFQKLKNIYLPNMLSETQKKICHMQYKQDMFMEWGKLVPYFIGLIFILILIVFILIKIMKTKSSKKKIDNSRITKISKDDWINTN